MEQTYLIKLIKTLDTGEQQELALFAASPFFNRGTQSEDVRKLLQTILYAAPDFEKIEKMFVYQEVFPGKEFIEGKLEKTMAELSKLIRSFLLTQKYFDASNEFQQMLDWASLLRTRDLDSRYQQTIDKLVKTQQTNIVESEAHYYRQFLLETEIHDWQSSYNRFKGDLNLPRLIHNLDIYYFVHRLEFLNRFLLQQKVTHLEIPEEIAHALNETNLPERYLRESVVLLISDKINQLLKQNPPTLEAFLALTDLLRTHENGIGTALLRQFFAYLRSLCTILINAGAEELIPALHQLHRDNLERGYFYFENKIHPPAYVAVVTAALRVRNFDWALHFIESHKNRIIGDNETHDFYRLNLANYYFEIGAYEKSQELIPASSPDLDYHFRARRLELKIYYESDSELLPYKIDAFKMFVSRASNKLLSPRFKELQGNFVNLLHQLSQSIAGDKDRSQKLVQRILTKAAVAERDWLLEKARQLR